MLILIVMIESPLPPPQKKERLRGRFSSGSEIEHKAWIQILQMRIRNTNRRVVRPVRSRVLLNIYLLSQYVLLYRKM